MSEKVYTKQEQVPATAEITEVAPNILRTQLPIDMPGLGHVNMYVLEDSRGVAVVDPGLPGKATIEFIALHVPEPRSVPLCGNSIGTDRRFLAKYLPEIENYLHYRSVDVSSIKELSKRWYPKVGIDRPNKGGSHRAMDDIKESVRELQFYRDKLFVTEVVNKNSQA